MTDFYLGVTPQRMEYALRSNTARFNSPLVGTTKTASRYGDRLAPTFVWDALRPADAARMIAFISQQRGGANRFWASPPEYSQRGSFAASELISNNVFANGTTGWTVTGAGAGSIAAVDSELRVTRGANGSVGAVSANVVVTPYAPYCGRAMVLNGLSQGGAQSLLHYFDDTGSITAQATGVGLQTLAIVPAMALARLVPQDQSTNSLAGDYFTMPYTSIARCALVDNGTNLLQRAEEMDNAYWTKTRSSVLGNSQTAPNGTATGERIVEDATASNSHLIERTVTVAATALDYSFSVALRAGTRTWGFLQLFEATTSISAYFNLSTGAIGTTAAGANWSGVRAFIAPLGDSWYQCTIVGRKTSAATSLIATIQLATGNGGASYSGDGASYISAWRATLAQSGVAPKLVLTTSAASTGTSQTGSALYLKGLPASSSGLLLVGDWVEIISGTYSELKRVVAPLNSDASGLGYLQFEPILRYAPSDGAAVIVRRPMGRFLLDESTVEWGVSGEGYHSLRFTAVEDIAA